MYMISGKNDGLALITEFEWDGDIYDCIDGYWIFDVDKPFKNGDDSTLFNYLTNYMYCNQIIENPFECLVRESFYLDNVCLKIYKPTILSRRGEDLLIRNCSDSLIYRDIRS